MTREKNVKDVDADQVILLARSAIVLPWMAERLFTPPNQRVRCGVALRFFRSCGIVVMGVILEQCRAGEVGAAALHDPAALGDPRCGIGARP